MEKIILTQWGNQNKISFTHIQETLEKQLTSVASKMGLIPKSFFSEKPQ